MGILQRIGLIRDSLCIHVLEAGENTSQQMGTLREIWLLSSSALAEMVIIRSRGATRVTGERGQFFTIDKINYE